MKKSIVLIVAAAALFAACAKDTPIENTEAIPATISVTIPADGLTKVALEQDTNPDGAVKLTWESTDVITVKNAADESKSVAFAYTSGAGTASAEFSAADISPLAGATSYNIYLTSNLPGGFTSQTQASDGSTAHLGYAATLSGVNKYDGATFSQSWATSNGGGTLESSSVLRIRAQMPTAAIADAVQKVIVKSSAYIFDESNEMEITITTPGVEGDGKVVTVYATLPPGNIDIASNTELVFQFQVSADENDKYTAYRKLASATHFYGGQVNFFKINCPDIASYAGPEDDGTAEHPYLIGDRYQMNKMRGLLEKDKRIYFKMVDDVDLSGITWEPVNSSDDYQIDFNGGGHIISHLTINGASASNSYSGFFGLLHGFIHEVTFDSANVDGGNKNSGIVIGRSGPSSHAANFSNVTVRNSTLTSSNNYVGGLAGYVKKSNSIMNCHVINSTITSTAGSVNPSLVGGLVGEMVPNAGCTLSDCSAEDVTVNGGCTNTNRSGVGGLIGRINASGVVITRCHSTGTLAASNANNVGGLVGHILTGSSHSISNSYSTCTITRGYTYAGGLVGKIAGTYTADEVTYNVVCTIDHCFASGDIALKGGYGGHGGLVGAILGEGVSLQNSIAWNGKISAGHDSSDESSGAVVGYTHPNCVLTNNYRKTGITFNSFVWAPSASFDHPNVSGTTTPLKINSAGDESNLTDGTAADFTTANKKFYSYHGKHLPAGTEVVPDDKYGFISAPSIEGIPDPVVEDPEDPDWSDTPTINLVALGGTSHTLCEGVEYINFHGQWEGQWREINVIKTTLNSHNSLGIYYNYSDDGRLYLDEKCEYLDAIAGTNGPMACCHFVRINGEVKHGASAQNSWTVNSAITINAGTVDIVKVKDNYDAATLPDPTVGCAGPMLVWKGNIQSYDNENSEAFLANTHPRTAIGLSKDGKTVIQVTVDGRWTSSNTSKRAIGMSTPTLSQLMRGLGCYKAMNFDGGGGSQMWVYGYGDIHNIVNHPHNTWPVYGTTPESYYWIKNNEVARRTTGNAVYIYSDLK